MARLSTRSSGALSPTPAVRKGPRPAMVVDGGHLRDLPPPVELLDPVLAELLQVVEAHPVVPI
jgi:hypothetical protein